MILKINPVCASAFYYLSFIAFQKKVFNKAIDYAMKAHAIKPHDVDVVRIIANSYIELSQFHDALFWSEKLIDLNKQDEIAMYNVGVIFMRLNQYENAKNAFNSAIQLKPDYIDAYVNLAAIAMKQENRMQAERAYQTILKFNPTHAIANYMLRSTSFLSAPRDYIYHLYDHYAAGYEEHVIHDLRYQVPAVFKKIVKNYISKKERALDLGCGTGLAAAELQGFSNSIVGIDLSLEMLKKAKEKNLYQELIQIDMVEYFDHCEIQFDLIYAADSLLYCGDLLPLFKKIKQHLKPSGLFIFSVESLKNSSSDFSLQKTGRFAHSLQYLKKVIFLSGLTYLKFEKVVLRKQKEADVEGWIAVTTVE